MNMQLSNREKLLVLVLTIFAVIAGFYYFIEKPQLAKIEDLKKIKLDYQQKVQTLNLQTSSNNAIYKENADLEKKIKDLTVKFFPTISQEKIVTILDGKFQASKFQPDSMTFDNKGLSIKEAESEKQTEDEKAKSEDLLGEMSMTFHSLKPVVTNAEAQREKDRKSFEKAINSITRLGVTLSFEGNYEDLSLFIKQLEGDKRRIIVDSIQCEKAENDKLRGTVELSFYAIPKLFFQDDDYYQWNFKNKYGKYNPFFLSGGTMNTPSGISGTTSTSDKVDFFMTLKPIVSDVPTVMIGKKGDASSKTYLYADNAYNEDVEIELTQSGSNYYYRYKTRTGSYPAKSSKPELFTPIGNQIVLEIMSSKRQSTDDNSGANIKITNSTDLTVQANVLFDDKKDHRAKFVKGTGTVVTSSTMEE